MRLNRKKYGLNCSKYKIFGVLIKLINPCHSSSFSLIHQKSRLSSQACSVISFLRNSLEVSMLTENGRKQILSPSLLLGSCILLSPREDTKLTRLFVILSACSFPSHSKRMSQQWLVSIFQVTVLKMHPE